MKKGLSINQLEYAARGTSFAKFSNMNYQLKHKHKLYFDNYLVFSYHLTYYP